MSFITAVVIGFAVFGICVILFGLLCVLADLMR